jgi:hypothetical protein
METVLETVMGVVMVFGRDERTTLREMSEQRNVTRKIRIEGERVTKRVTVEGVLVLASS